MTDAEKERLYMLSEEAGEIVQIVGKILRHGYNSYHPDDPMKETNLELLIKELNDINGVIAGMCRGGELHLTSFGFHNAVAAWERKLKWTRHQGYINAKN